MPTSPGPSGARGARAGATKARGARSGPAKSGAKRRSAGWVPNQHGAWAMLAVPFAVGVARGAADHTFAWVVVPLGLMWFVGYFAFFALGLWLKSGRKPRYVRAVQVYGVVTAVLGALVLVGEARLALWAPAFAPFLGVGLWAAKQRSDRTVLSGAVTVAAACLMTLVAYDACRGADGTWGPAPIVAVAVFLYAYFFGTVLYVKSLIRGRGKRGYAVASVGYHAAVTVGAVAMAVLRGPTWWLAAVFLAIMTARAWVLLGRKLTPKVIGLGEVAASTAALVVALLVG